jgi:hypothetical protein
MHDYYEDSKVPLTEPVGSQTKNYQTFVNNPVSENIDMRTEFLQSLNQIMILAIGKVRTNKTIKLINQIQDLLNDAQKSDEEKLILTCHIIEKSLNDSALRNELPENFFKLFKKEVLDFFYQEMAKTVKNNQNELINRFNVVNQWLSGQMIIPSPLRNLLDELRELAEKCAKNTWLIPTGVAQLIELLSDLDWLEDGELLRVLQSCTHIIEERMKFAYLYRHTFTYFLYRNFYSVLSTISKENSFEDINKKIIDVNSAQVEQQHNTTKAFKSLHLYLVELKTQVNQDFFNKKGKVLGIFANKIPNGIYRLRVSLEKLPNLPRNCENQVQLIKVFMQIKDILFEKNLPPSTPGPSNFRDPDVETFYKDWHRQIQFIYNSLSFFDKEVFFAAVMDKNDKDTLDNLVVPKGHAILLSPEKIYSALEKMQELFGEGCRPSR